MVRHTHMGMQRYMDRNIRVHIHTRVCVCMCTYTGLQLRLLASYFQPTCKSISTNIMHARIHIKNVNERLPLPWMPSQSWNLSSLSHCHCLPLFQHIHLRMLKYMHCMIYIHPCTHEYMHCMIYIHPRTHECMHCMIYTFLICTRICQVLHLSSKPLISPSNMHFSWSLACMRASSCSQWYLFLLKSSDSAL